jgi:hypothetical protein
MTSTEPRYHLYGLAAGNPYAHRPLNPLTTPTDGDRLLDLEGFIRREDVETYLQEKTDSEQPAFILVGGRNHTGRTSLANWIVHSYFKLRDVRDRFLCVCVPVADQATFPWLMKAIAKLWAKLTLTSDLTLNPEVLDGIKDCLAAKADMPYEELFQAALGTLSIELTSRKYAIGVVFEGIPNAEFVASVKTVFESSEAVVVCTYDDYEHPQTTGAKGFRAVQFDDVLDVYLEPLASRQVLLLAEGRWEGASPREFPFEGCGLEDLYKDNRTPIRKVLKRLEDFLDYKLEITPRDAAAWPANRELFMGRQWLAPTFKRLDRSP